MKILFLSVLLFCFVNVAIVAQVPAQWNRVFDTQYAQGIELGDNGESVFVWGRGADSTCFQSAPSIIKVDTSGITLLDSTYTLNFCAAENTIDFEVAYSDSGFYFITTNNVVTPQDSSFAYYFDSNSAVQWSQYIGWKPRASLVRSGTFYYTSSDQNGQAPRQVLRFTNEGILDTFNVVTDSYFNWAPQYILYEDTSIIEVGHWPNLDTAFMCIRYDTSGNYLNSFVFDADQNQTEIPFHVETGGATLFHVSCTISNNKTYPGCSNFSGSTLWLDTLNHRIHSYQGACIDSINNIGFVFCDGTAFRYIFSYNLATGMRQDSIAIDSADVMFSGIKSGPAGGVYVMYNKRFTNQIIVEQYDAGLNLLWSGWTQHPSCSNACDPQDFIIDTLGFIYTVSNCGSCGNTLLVSKFGPSLVGLEETTTTNEIQLYPNPASSFVLISLTEPLKPMDQLSVFNSTGQLVYFAKCPEAVYTLNATSFIAGLYFVRVTSESGQFYTRKLIIQH